jgi:sigma-B regulation protein RsbU (phosphoserine phosphatase)
MSAAAIHAQTTADPVEMLIALLATLQDELTVTEMHISIFYAVIDPKRRQIRYANAGHPMPFHLRRSAGVVEHLALAEGQCGPALGLHEEAIYATAERPMAVNDLIVLFTDGLFEVENANKEYFGQERLLEAVRKRINQPPPKLFGELLAEIPIYSSTGNFTDDVCIVGMEVARTGS